MPRRRRRRHGASRDARQRLGVGIASLGLTIVGFEVRFEIVVIGAILGMTYGLLAVGLVLVHRSNRIVNFAHAEIGALAAVVLGLAVGRWHVPYWPAFGMALAIGAGTGAAAEVVVIRRLRRAPALMSIVGTLGLGQFLLLLSFVLNAQNRSFQTFPQPPWLPELDIGTLHLTSAYTAILVLSPLVAIGLAMFLARSHFGLTIRAAAGNAEGARMAGVPAARMSTASWAIAGAVAAFTAALVFATTGFVSDDALGPGLLLRALVPAVAARLTSLPIALVAGIGVGIVEQVVLWNHPRGGVVEVVLLAGVLVLVLLRPRAGARDDDGGAEWSSVRAASPVPAPLAASAVWRRLRAGGWAIAIAIGAGAPLVVGNGDATVLSGVIALAIVGISVNVVTGLAGQLSLGQLAFAGLGAGVSYQLAHLTGNHGIALLGASAAGGAAAAIVGLPALRAKGLLLAITTLAFALASSASFLEVPWLLGVGVAPGRPVLDGRPLDTGRAYYYFALGALVLVLWLAHNLRRGGLARRLVAVRDNEQAARAFGIAPDRAKIRAFVTAGAIAGVGGAIYAHTLSQVDARTFPVAGAVDVVAMSVLGGIGTLTGPLLGALYIYALPSFVPLDSAGLAASSLGWLVLILYFPGGLAEVVAPLRERLVVAAAKAAGITRQDVVPEAKAEARMATTPMPTAMPSIAAPRSDGGIGSVTVLEAEGLRKRYGGVVAVDGVGIRVRRGETLGIIGPNGAGKTTLFDLLSGFTHPDEGTVSLDGRDITRATPEDRTRLGLVRSFQDARLFPTLTVAEVVALALERTNPTPLLPALIGLDSSERARADRADELLGLMGLASYRETPIAALSTGTRRICELASIVALEPTVLLLDEPSSGVAQRETEALGEVIVRLKAHLGMTLVLIEHDMPLLFGLSDRVVAMNTGRVIAEGSPAEVQRDPAVIESYLGDDPVAVHRSGQAAAGAATAGAVARR